MFKGTQMSHSLVTFSYNMHVLTLAVRLGEGELPVAAGQKKSLRSLRRRLSGILIIIP